MQLKEQGSHLGSIIVPEGETSKSYDQLFALSEELLALETERRDILIAFGGGVVGDLAGFAASIVRRGIHFVQIPTTLLSQVDSSVGGKTGINSPQGKNLIGAFHQPDLVLADTSVLETLPKRQFKAGYAELAKIGLIQDKQFFSWLEKNWKAILNSNGDERARAIEVACRAKAVIVSEDERETGRRALLNLGHTFGHALEAWAGYGDRLLHGEAIAIGAILAFRFSESLGLCPSGTASRVTSHFRDVGLPTEISNVPGQHRPQALELLKLMSQDKKIVGGVPAFILTKGIGEAFITRDVPRDKLAAFLTEQCKESS
jgi:shikimate kinase/3-dehydroquinate synthase